MFGLFKNRNKTLDDILEQSERMEKYYLEKAIEYAKYSATLNKMADTYGKYYRQGIEDTLKAIRGTRKDDSK